MRPAVAGLALMAALPLFGLVSAQAQTIRPVTWNVVGLDSNNVNVGPNVFPIGARVCAGASPLSEHKARFVWVTTDANITRTSPEIIALPTIAANSCQDVFHEVTVTRSAAAYTKRAQYRIELLNAGDGVVNSTPTNREIFVERLISQNRNAVRGILVDDASVPFGNTIPLQVGRTYSIRLDGKTATQGYEQLEEFLTLTTDAFRVNSVASTYSANAGTDPEAATKIYADGCKWVNDITDLTIAPTYRQCEAVGKYGGTTSLTYNVTVTGGGGTTKKIQALIYDFSGSSYHYNGDYGTSFVNFAIVNEADLAITKTDNETSVTSPGNITYQIVVTNNGPAEVTGATVADTAPTDVTFGTWTCAVTNPGTGGTVQTACGNASGSGSLNETVTMKSGAVITYTIPATVAGATRTITNTATVTAPANVTDPTPGNNSASDNTSAAQVPTTADISITKAFTGQSAGVDANFELTVSNLGPGAPSGDVIVEDLVPTGYTFGNLPGGSGPSLSSWSAPPSVTGPVQPDPVNNPRLIRWTIPAASLPATTPATTIVLGMRLSFSGSGGALSNTATVNSPNDPNSDNDTSTAFPTDAADLAVTKTDGLTNAAPGSNTTYTIVVTNNGPVGIANLTVSDPQPANVTFNSWTCSVTKNVAGSLTNACGATTGGPGSLATTATLNVGAEVTYTVQATFGSGASGPIVNTATVAVPTGFRDPVIGNDTASDTTTVQPAADLAVVKTVDKPAPLVGELVTFLVTVTNNGPSSVSGATIVDTLPDGFDLSPAPTVACTASGAGSACVSQSFASRTMTALANLGVGGSVQYTIVARVNGTGTSWLNTATATTPSGINDPTPGNNTASASADPAIVLIAKTSSKSSYAPSETATFTISVEKTGNPANLGVITVTEDPPPGLTLVSISGAPGSGWSCSPGITTSICTRNDVDAFLGAYPPITVTATFDPGALTPPSTSFENLAFVSNGDGSKYSEATRTITVSEAPDMAISLLGLPASATVGVPYSGSFTCTNIGSVTAAAGTTCQVTGLPDGVTQGACSINLPSTGPWVANDPVPPNAIVTCSVSGTPTTAGPVTINGSTGATGDGNPGNNTDSLSLTVTAPTPTADMTSSVVCTQNPATAGSLVSCAVTCTNIGTITATGATCSVTNAGSLPPGSSVVCPTGAVDVPAGSSLGCNVLFSAPPSGGPITVAVATTATNDANGGSDPAAGNNPSSTAVAINPAPTTPDTADMVSSVSCSPTPGSIGSAVICTAVCENIGTATANGATCSINTTGLPPTRTLSCSAPGAVAPGNVQVCTLSFTTTDTVPVLVRASATAINDANGGTDPMAGNNPSEVTVPINPTRTGPDMTSQVTCTPNPASAGQTVSCTVTCTNVGSAPAGGAFCRFLNANSLPGAPTASCPSGLTVGVGESLSCSISFVSNGSRIPVQGGTGATGDVNGGTIDTAGNNPSVTPVVGGPLANLSIQKTGTPSLVPSGGTVTYSIVVANDGPAAADGATLSDAVLGLPGFNPDAGTVACNVTSGTAACPTTPVAISAFLGGTAITLSTFPANSSLTFSYSGTVGNTAGVITNTATLNPPPGVTPGTPLNSSPQTAVDLPEARLRLDKSGPSPVSPGATMQYKIVVTNDGPAAADGARVQDPAVAGFTATSVTCVPGTSAACPIPVAPSSTLSVNDLQQGGLVIPTLPPNSSVEFTLTGTAGASGAITNYATVFAPKGVFDPDITDNTDAAYTVITTSPVFADLALLKLGPAIVSPGESITYTITVANLPSSTVAVANAIVKDPKPANVLSYNEITCGNAQNFATCPGSINVAAFETNGVAIPSLPPGSSLDLTIKATAGTGGSIFNYATVAAPPGGPLDPNPINNFSTVVTSMEQNILTSVDLQVVKTGPSSIGSAGRLTYKILVKNKGPGSASGAKLFDVLAGTLDNPTVTCSKPVNSLAACPDASGVTWAMITGEGVTLTSLPAPSGADNSSLEFTVTGTAGSGGVVFNTASVSPPAGTFDADPRDNSSSVSTVVIASGPGADLKVIKSGPSSASPNTDVTYTITVMNLGNVDANGALLRDPEVANFTAQTVSCANTGFPQGTCPSFPTVTELQSGIVIPALPVGSSIQFTLVGRAGASGNIVNTATIYSPPGLSDPVLTNNASTKTTSLGGGGPPPNPGTITGFVWYDTNGNNTKDPGEPPRGGWKVELVLGGSVVATTITGLDGSYSFGGLLPNTYSVRFTTVPRAVVPGGGPVNGDTSGNGGTPSGMELTGINVSGGAGVVNQSLPIDPSGVVYDATARIPVSGATVTLLYNGTPANPIYVAGGSNTDTSAAGGQYAFFLLPGAPAAGTWGLRVDPITAYAGTPSSLIPPTTAPAGYPGGSVGTVGVPPQGAVTTYYLAFPLPSIDITNNNIPLDPAAKPIPATSPGFLALLALLLAGATVWAALKRRRELDR